LGIAFWEEADSAGQITALPPAVAVKFIFLDNFYTLASTEGDLVFVLWDKVVSCINVFEHEEGGRKEEWGDGEESDLGVSK
jgi:hypothetical protein